jgi:hypothetical protein
LREKESENGKRFGKNNLAKYIDTVRAPLGTSAKKHLYYLYGYKSAKRGLKFELTLEEFSNLTKSPCYYCGAEPSQVKKYKKANGNYIYNGIDRFDNAKGYIKDNCVPCCKQCNTAKMEMSADEFADWIMRAYRHFAVYRNVGYTYSFSDNEMKELGIPS